MTEGYSIFFDLDDTLYDRSDPFRKAFLIWYPDRTDTARAAYWACEKRGNEVFLPSQRGEITMDEMYIYRYQKGLADVGIRITPEEALAFQELYRERQQEILPGEGVPELLDFCCEHFCHVGLITNGPAEKQKGKIRTLGLNRWIPEELMLISGVLKIDKPDPEIFHMAEKRADSGPEQMIYVGDSIANDIRPAQALGWKTVFLNRKSVSSESEDLHPDLVLTGEEVLTKEHLLKLTETEELYV